MDRGRKCDPTSSEARAVRQRTNLISEEYSGLAKQLLHIAEELKLESDRQLAGRIIPGSEPCSLDRKLPDWAKGNVNLRG